MAVKLLKDVMPLEFMGCEYTNTPARKFADIEVQSEHMGHSTRWPGTHKNVMFWVKLKNGKAVGFNENPGRGWSFPVINLSKKGRDHG